MDTTYKIHCSNCGSIGTRRYFTGNDNIYSCCPSGLVVQTECPTCDYLMVICSLNGKVLEAHHSATSTRMKTINYPTTITANRQKTVPLLRQISA